MRAEQVSAAQDLGAEVPLIVVEGLRKEFRRRREVPLAALDGVSIEVKRGETLAVVGQSGSGKTTLGRCIVGLLEPTSGRVLIEGKEAHSQDRHERRAARRNVQVVFQDPSSSLDPTMKIAQIVCEPITIQRGISRSELREQAAELLDKVGLKRAFVDRRPHELSGGEQQRVAIARAISTKPKLIVLDEPTSSVDFELRRHLLTLLRELQTMESLTYLFITHDLVTAEYMAGRTAVMYAGRVVEEGPTVDVLRKPRHPYTRILVDSALSTRSGHRPSVRLEVIVDEDRTWDGCAFRGRCPLAADRCSHEAPLLRTVLPAHRAACHFSEALGFPEVGEEA